MYSAHYKNPLFQFQIRTWRLVLTDSDGLLPTVKVEKSFPRPLATQIALEAYANGLAAQVLAEQDPPQELPSPIAVTIDLPAGKEMTP